MLVSWIQEICGSIKETANVFYFYIYFFRTKYKFLSQWRKYTKAKSLSVTYLKFRAGAGLTFSQRAARAELLHEGRWVGTERDPSTGRALPTQDVIPQDANTVGAQSPAVVTGSTDSPMRCEGPAMSSRQRMASVQGPSSSQGCRQVRLRWRMGSGVSDRGSWLKLFRAIRSCQYVQSPDKHILKDLGILFLHVCCVSTQLAHLLQWDYNSSIHSFPSF